MMHLYGVHRGEHHVAVGPAAQQRSVTTPTGWLRENGLRAAEQKFDARKRHTGTSVPRGLWGEKMDVGGQ